MEIIANWTKIESSTPLHPGDIIACWENVANEKIHVQFVIQDISSKTIRAERTMIGGLVLSKGKRETKSFDITELISNNFKLLMDKTNDRHHWPKTLNEAIKKLEKQYSKSELIQISNMTWTQFEEKFNSFGGLGQWIRNYFGIWRGNFELYLSCNIESPMDDNVSYAIMYHFWETLRDRKPI